MASAGPSQPKKRRTKYSADYTKEYSFIKKCSKNVHDHEYKFHCSICNLNLSCAHGGIQDVRDHLNRDKHKAAKKSYDSQFIFYITILISCYIFGQLYFGREYRIFSVLFLHLFLV